MKKLGFLLVGCTIILAGLACREKAKLSEQDIAGSQLHSQLEQVDQDGDPSQTEPPIEQEPQPEHKSDPVLLPSPELADPSEPLEPIAGVSTKELDDRIMREAAAKGVDPKKHRTFVRNEPRGAKVFRELGVFVIIGAVGDTVYLPDEI